MGEAQQHFCDSAQGGQHAQSDILMPVEPTGSYSEPLPRYTVELRSHGGGQRYLLAVSVAAVLCYVSSLSVALTAFVLVVLPPVLQHWWRPSDSIWDQVVEEHAAEIAEVERETARFLGQRRFLAMTSVMGLLVRALPLQWCDEVVAISRKTGLSVGCLVALGLY